MRHVIPLLLVLALLGACSVGDDDEAVAEPTPTAPTSAAVTAPSTTLRSSAGTVSVGDAIYELNVTCIAPGAGEVLAIGVGETVDGELVEAYIQAFLGAPYIGLQIGETLLEASFDGTLELYLQDDEIRASAIRFVTDLDLATGEGDFVGLGSVEIACDAYEEEVPVTELG